MKICMFTNTYLPHVGGVARSVAAFTEDLRQRGHSVLIVCPEFSGSEKIDQADPDIVRVPAIQNFNGSDFSVRLPLPFNVDDRIDAFAPDIIHSHHPFLMGDSALRQARQRRLPLVFTHHTMYEQYTHYVPLDSPAMQQFAVGLATEYANLCDRVIAPSESTARLLDARGVASPVTAMPTGVDVPFFKYGRGNRFRTAQGIARNAVVAGHLGRLAPEKNLKYLAAAALLFVKKAPQRRFLVAGSGPAEEEIVRMFNKNNVADRLVLPGKLTGRALQDGYKAMDFFVFASKSETQGMVLTEAMAAGLPVIALDAPGAREVVQNNVNGLLLSGEADVREFAAAMDRAASCTDDRKRWKKQAVKTAWHFSRDACAKRLEKLYEEVCQECRDDAGKNNETLIPWDTLLGAISAEWDLLSEKAAAIARTVNGNSHGKAG